MMMSDNISLLRENKIPVKESVVFPSVVQRQDNRQINQNDSFDRFIREMEKN
jgi:hypothetical protein